MPQHARAVATATRAVVVARVDVDVDVDVDDDDLLAEAELAQPHPLCQSRCLSAVTQQRAVARWYNVVGRATLTAANASGLPVKLVRLNDRRRTLGSRVWSRYTAIRARWWWLTDPSLLLEGRERIVFETLRRR